MKSQPFKLIQFLFLVCNSLACAYPCKAQSDWIAMTYNIRLKTKTDGPNYWPERREKVFTLIKKQQPDVLGMQEVLYAQLVDLKRALPGYHSVGVGRSDGKRKGEFSPVFFRKERFDLLDSGTFWLSEHPDKPGSVGWDAAITRICSWAKLKCKKTDQTFFVFNTHFDHKGKSARVNSSKFILSKVEEIAGNAPFLLCGDFNFTPDSEAYRTLMSGNQLTDVFLIPGLFQGNTIGTFSGFNVEEKNTLNRIDYLFIPSSIKAKSCNIITDNDGTYYPSDHLPLVGTFEFK